jgi:hypothetical protein
MKCAGNPKQGVSRSPAESMKKGMTKSNIFIASQCLAQSGAVRRRAMS